MSFWYWVRFSLATLLKYSTLDLLRDIVTFTDSSRRTSWSGEGRKSFTTLTLPIASFVYLVFFLIYPLPFPPVARAENSYHVLPIGEPYRYDPSCNLHQVTYGDLFHTSPRLAYDPSWPDGAQMSPIAG